MAAASAVAAAAGVLAAVGAGGVGDEPSPPFIPPAVRHPSPTRLLTPAGSTPRARSGQSAATRHFEYVFPEKEMDVYDIDHGFKLVQRVAIPDAHAVRGVAASPRSHTLFLTVGGDGGSTGNGKLLALDLLTGRVLWERSFPTGVDSAALTPDGRTLFVPTGERSSGDVWYVVRTRDGAVTAAIHGGAGPHNTIVGPGGARVYLGPRNDDYLYVAATRTDQVVRRIGPLYPDVRPFTIDGAERYAFTTATGFLGFQVSSLATGRVLYTVPVKGFPYDPSTFTRTAPSHGIAISPDNRTVWVIDTPSSYVHEFDVSGLPTRAPQQIADVKLTRAMTGNESPCGEDCERDGWLQLSADGRYLFVGDSGDVVDTRTHRVVAFLPALWNSRYPIEIDWRRGVPVATTTRSSIGRP